MKKRILFISLVLSLSVSFGYESKAQLLPGANQTLDKIVAVVGNEIIMASDLNAALMMVKQQSPSIDINDPVLRRQVLDNIINEKLVITKAIEDSVKVSDEEVESRWSALLQNMVRRFGSEQRVEEVYGMSINRIRFEYRDEIRKQILGAKLRQEHVADITASPEEVNTFYNQFKDSLDMMPEQVELYHIVKYIGTSKSKKEDVLNFARKIRDSIVAGGDFADFARRYSDDPGSKSGGGDLGWASKGKLFPEFEKAAYALQPDEISLPVETPFGYHIIQVIDKRNDEIKARHILFKFGESDEDIETAKRFLDSLKKEIESGKDFETLARMNSDDKESRGFGGLLGKMPIDELPNQMKVLVQNMKDGEVTDPIPYSKDPLKKGYHIVYKKRSISAHKANISEDYKRLEQLALFYKQNMAIKDWIEQLRKELYWEIKEL
jgi:peptidyl-prolyl cis-trans isomerase SurA